MMAAFSNVSSLLIILLSYNCEVSSKNNFDTQIAKIEDRLQTMTESIYNLKRDLQKESTERRKNTEVLNRKISQYTSEIQGINQQQNFSDNLRVGSDVLGCVDPKKVKIWERGLAKEKFLRIMTEEKVNSLVKELETMRNLKESRLNEQKDDLKVQKDMIKALENDVGQVHANVSILKTDINNMASDIRSIRTDVLSTKGDTGERLRNFQAWIKTVEGNVENMKTTLENDIGQVHANVSSLKTDITNMASDIGSIRTDVLSTKGDTGERLRNFQAWIKTVEGNVENIKTTFKSDSPQIAFHARLSKSRSQFSSGDVIIFDDVYVNLGNGYHKHRGVFRVPIEGIYIVLMTVSSEVMRAPDYEVVRNETPLCRAAVATHDALGPHSGTIWLGSTCNAILPLNIGDEIWARVILNRPTDKVRGGLFSTFSIGLISMK